MIYRRKQDINSALEPKRVLVVYGPRRVGKTTLLNEYVKTQSEKRVYFSTGDDIDLRKINLKQKIETQVPISIVGTSSAVEENHGILLTLTTEITIESLPADIPDSIEIDISKLKEIGSNTYFRST